MFSQFLSLLIWIQLWGAQTVSSVEPSPDMTVECAKRIGPCKAEVMVWNGTESELEISCVCRFDESRDVAEYLNIIQDRRCDKHFPQKPTDKPLWKSILRLENCDVKSDVFPVGLVRLLRRSLDFSIFVKGAKTLRLKKDPSPEKVAPSITAVFENSEMSGIPKGWFTGASSVNLNVTRSVIEVISEGAFNEFPKNSTVNLSFTTSNILTIKSFSISLPPEGFLNIEGGKVEQWETNAYQGGKTLSLEGVKITNISTRGINLYSLKRFNMDSCYIAQLQETFLYERQLDVTSSFEGVDEVTIIDNSIAKTHPKAFGGLCRENTLNFTNNYLGIIDGPITLKLAECAKERDWVNSTINTGLRCDDCSSLLSSLDEQICSVYRTSWCITCDVQHPEDTTVFYTPNSLPTCKTHFYDYVWSTCSYAQSKGYERKCTEALDGKSLYVISGGSNLANSIVYLAICLSLCFKVLFLFNKACII